MTTSTAPTAHPESAQAPTLPVHYHITESLPGYLPESDPRLATDPEDALDAVADLLTDWADANDPDDDDPDGVGDEEVTAALGTAELYRAGGSSAEHGDLLARLARHGGVAEYVGNRVIEARTCTDRDCLKYCPAEDCRTVAEITDTDHRCWCCGTRYVGAEDCAWLDPTPATAP
jgi:hypothetical protein